MPLYIPIWFYSNGMVTPLQYNDSTLHSNLVLFKYKRITVIRTKLYLFTFQSGSIQMEANHF